MKQFKIRCSQIGGLMTSPRSKSDKEQGNLSRTAKTIVENWLREQLYGRRLEFVSKYTEKGNITEDAGIRMISQHFFKEYVKNEEHFENDFMTGTPDIIDEIIIDNKSSFSFKTFPLFTETIDKNYWSQLQGYMCLTGRNKAKLIYTLNDTPIEIIEREISYYCKERQIEVTDEIIEKMYHSHTYDDLDSTLRIRIYDIDYDAEFIVEIEKKVMKAREYISELREKIDKH